MFWHALLPKIMIYFQLAAGVAAFLFKAPRRKKFALRLVLSVLASIALIVAYVALERLNDNVALSILSYIFAMLLLGASVYVCFDISVINTVRVTSGSYVLQHMGHLMTVFIMNVFGLKVPLWVTFITPFAFVAIVWLVFLRRRPTAYQGNDYKLVFMALLIIAVCIVLHSLRLKSVRTVFLDIYDFLLCLCCLLLQFWVTNNERAGNERRTLELILSKEHEQHEMSARAMLALNVKFHDIKNKLDSIQQIMSASGEEKEFDEIKRAVKVYSSVANTGNATLDVLLMEKGLLCELNDIRFSYIADGKLLGFMSPVDIFSLLNNTLDNALESSLKEPDKDKRMVALNISKAGEATLVCVENYCGTRVDFSDGLPQTTKSDAQNHSIGRQGIMMVVEKYGGIFRAEQDDDNIVHINIIFPR